MLPVFKTSQKSVRAKLKPENMVIMFDGVRFE